MDEKSKHNQYTAVECLICSCKKRISCSVITHMISQIVDAKLLNNTAPSICTKNGLEKLIAICYLTHLMSHIFSM